MVGEDGEVLWLSLIGSAGLVADDSAGVRPSGEVGGDDIGKSPSTSGPSVEPRALPVVLCVACMRT